MLKILQERLQQYMNRKLPDVQAGFRKGRGTRDQIANNFWKDWCWSWSCNTLATWCKELNQWKRPDAGKDWRQEEKGTTEENMFGWHHRLDGHEFEQTLRAGDWQGGLACPGHVHGVTNSRKRRSDWTELNWTECQCKSSVEHSLTPQKQGIAWQSSSQDSMLSLPSAWVQSLVVEPTSLTKWPKNIFKESIEVFVFNFRPILEPGSLKEASDT